jgi:transcriptional regulator with GAF, ATPase, and Fis domain
MAPELIAPSPKPSHVDPLQGHICAFFRDQTEEYKALLPFIKRGLESQNKVLLIVDPRLQKEYLHELEKAGIDVKSAAVRKQLEVMAWGEQAPRNSQFDRKAKLSRIEDVLKFGRSQGSIATKIIAHMEGFLGEYFIESMVRLHSILEKYNDLFISVYRTSRLDVGVVLDILRTHPAVMISGIMQRNPFFVPATELLQETHNRRTGARLLETGVTAENRRLRQTVRELVALSSMPATLIGTEPKQVAKETLAILMNGLQLDAAYVRLGTGDGTPVELLRAEKDSGVSGWVESLDKQSRAVDDIFLQRRIELVTGGKKLNVVQIPIGMEIDAGSIALASYRPDFPTEQEATVCSVAANQGFVSFQNARLIHERQLVEAELHVLKEEVDRGSVFDDIIGSSPAVKLILSKITKVAPTDSTVLITGETGTGKELVARAIHRRSKRSAKPFISVNCAALPSSLIASELFGHEKGAFTGADQRRLGRFELANGGTIFLDEVGELPLETQVALLRVLQERQFERIGGHQQISIDVRVVAATNRDLYAAITAGTFRSDLFYRIHVFPIEVPPLRDRKEDIPALVRHFVDWYAVKMGRKIRNIDPAAMEMLQAYRWPGNIRELQNVIERSLILCDRDTFSIDVAWLTTAPSHHKGGSLLERIIKYEREIIESALKESKGKVSGVTGAAGRLGIPPTTLESRIKALGVDKNRFRG